MKKYPTDLTDSQWNHIKDLFPKPKATGRPREVEFREIVNALLYLLFTGCQWRFIPNDYPPWRTCYGYFRAWQDAGLWYRIHETLRSDLRQKKGRHKHPTAGSLDSQSVKTTAVPSSRGFDAGKKIMGRKRHILVDTPLFDGRFGSNHGLCSRPRWIKEIVAFLWCASQEVAKDLDGRWLSRFSSRMGQEPFSLPIRSRLALGRDERICRVAAAVGG